MLVTPAGITTTPVQLLPSVTTPPSIVKVPPIQLTVWALAGLKTNPERARAKVVTSVAKLRI
jgi:hypothetical protein